MTYEKWAALGVDSWALAAEAQAVIVSRVARIARCDLGAMAEAQLMVTEKIASSATLLTMALTGKLGTTPYSNARGAVTHYRKAVARNRQRLAG